MLLLVSLHPRFVLYKSVIYYYLPGCNNVFLKPSKPFHDASTTLFYQVKATLNKALEGDMCGRAILCAGNRQHSTVKEESAHGAGCPIQACLCNARSI